MHPKGHATTLADTRAISSTRAALIPTPSTPAALVPVVLGSRSSQYAAMQPLNPLFLEQEY